MKYLLPLLLMITGSFAQNLKVIDKQTGDPVPFATVLLLRDGNTVDGIYCNEQGGITLGSTTAFDTVRITCLGFADMDISKADLKNGEIALVSTTYDLKEVVFEGFADTAILGEAKGKHNHWFAVSPEHTAACFIENTFGKPAYVRSLSITAEKVHYKTAFRVRMLSRKDFDRKIYIGDKTAIYPTFIPDSDILPENIIVYAEPQKKGVLELDLSGYAFELPPEGAFIAVECLGYYDGDTTIVPPNGKLVKFEMQFSEKDNYCLRYNLEGFWINVNQWVKSDFKYAFNNDNPSKKNFYAPAFRLKVDVPE